MDLDEDIIVPRLRKRGLLHLDLAHADIVDGLRVLGSSDILGDMLWVANVKEWTTRKMVECECVETCKVRVEAEKNSELST